LSDKCVTVRSNVWKLPSNAWKSRRKRMKCVRGITWVCLLGCAMAIFAGQGTLDISSVRSGVKVLKGYSGVPDRQGVLEYYDLKLPEIKRAVYYRGKWWPYGGNRVYGEVLNRESLEGGIFSILELKTGDYLAVLPLCGEQAYAWFAPENGVLKLRLGTRGNAAVKGNLPVVSWARADSPYLAANKAWKQATETEQIRGWMKMRGQKSYPEIFKYLGWCSWEAFHKKISSDKLVSAFKMLEANELPVRYILVDNGHFSPDTLMPKPDTFPHGYKPLTVLRNEQSIKWVGMWHALLGNPNAMSPGNPPVIAGAMMQLHNGRCVPKPDAQSIETFMRYLVSRSKRDGIDFVKVDFCGTLLSFYAGTEKAKVTALFPESAENAIGNPSAAATLFSRIYQQVIEEEFDGLLNCNWHVPHFIFNSLNNVLGRCGPDYKRNVKRARECVFISFSTIPWLGQVYWGDHDMFDSSDTLAARMMAISKALSGGPAYLSDEPADLVPEEVWPLCYLDGLLLRPLAPGAPVPEDIFMNEDDEQLYRVMAPLPNKAAAFACYNLQGDGKKPEPVIRTKITAEHYRAASSMIQPWTGEWDVPPEGLLVYDHQTKTARRLPGDGYPVELAGFGEYLLQFSPIQNGWSVIGRTDKYLSAAAVKILECGKKKLRVKLHESGPLAIWTENGKPTAKGIQFIDRGNGLFIADLPVRAESLIITIRK